MPKLDNIKLVQQKAFENMKTPEYWFRRYYNLPPTDPRYLEADKMTILIDFWTHILAERFGKLRHDGVDEKDITLETLTIDEQFDEELAKIKDETGEDFIINFDGAKA